MAPRIGDLVEVTAADTVVRLDGRPGRLDELVLTGDVRRSLAAVLEAATGDQGAGFLLVGHFGSGKSHFLAALAELLEAPGRVAGLHAWDAGTRELARAARPSLAVTVPLVEYRAEANLEDLVWRRAWHALGREPSRPSSDRTAAWGDLLRAVREAGRPGLLLLVDELSEFLKAKRGPGLTEDLRFLQFLGEWAREHPVLVVGALQESLDEVASVSERELARIRDRYPVRLGLSMRHVEDLVRGRLVLLRPGAEEEVERAYRALRSTLPGWRVASERFHACYPLHPDTLELLDGLRFLFSQQRGVVDFICRQLRGDPAAGTPAWLDRPYDDLLCPDRVYDHFQARLRERIETSRLAETVVPYFDRSLPVLLEAASDRELALRTVKLLTLLAASPLERRRSGGELAGMLLCRVSSVDPDANAAYLERAVLEPLAAHGAYVVARTPAGGRTTYEVELAADAAPTAARLMDQVRAQLAPDDRRIVDTLLELGGSPSLSLDLLRKGGRARRQVIWQQTLRHLLVTTARLDELGAAEVADLVGALERTGAEACLVVAEPEPADPGLADRAAELAGASSRLAIWVPDALMAGEAEFAVELLCRQVVLRQAADEGRGSASGLLEFLGRALESDVARAREIVRRLYFQGQIVAAGLGSDLDLPSLSGLTFDGVLRAVAGPLLHGLHPRHREVQPYAELVSDRHVRRLLSVALAGPRLTTTAADREGVRGHVEGYLVPLGVVRRRGDAYHVAPDPSRSPAVAELLRLVGEGPVPAGDLARALADGPVGLSEPETLLLLNGAVQSGVVEALRGRRRVEAPFFAVGEVERFGPGELVAPELRRLVPQLTGVLGPGPHEPWDARVQQASWEHARTWVEARREEAAQVRDGMRRLAETPLQVDAQLGSLPADLELLEELCAAVDVQAAPRRGLEDLLGAVADPDALLAAARRVAATARFCRADLGAFTAAAGYLLDPALVIPEAPEYDRLRGAREDALSLAARVLPLAAEDAARDVFAACDQFRRMFAAAYESEHARFPAAAGPEAALAVTGSPEYRALAQLAEVAAAAVPDDRVRVDRALTAGTVAPCQRRVETELALRPVCGCSFTLGTEPPRLDVAALVATAARGVAQHLAELAQPETRARLERAAEDLASLGQSEVGGDLSRVLALAQSPPADPQALAHLLEGPVKGVLRQVLRGAQVVVRRDLAALRDDLAGRRYPRRRLLELLQAWVDGEQPLADQVVVEVQDSAEAGAASARPGSGGTGGTGGEGGATVAFLRARFPRLAVRLPRERAADAFWLAAWWAGAPGLRPAPPAWLPASLLEEPDQLRQAALAAALEAGPRAELAALDARVEARTLAGDQVAAALGAGGLATPELVTALLGERLLRHPVRLAAAELARRLAADVRLVERVPADAVSRLTAGHVLLTGAELAPLGSLFDLARTLARLESSLPADGPVQLVEEVYPAAHAPVAALLSEAESGWAVFGAPADGLQRMRATASRLLGESAAAFEAAGGAGFPGCLRIWEVGDAVVAPLLRDYPRVAVLLVDGMRADVWLRLREPLREVLPRRRLHERWAVVPAPTRTAEAVGALALGRPVAAGELDGEAPPAPFAHLGYETAVLHAVDRDVRPQDLMELWRSGPRLAVAVATGVDERLHRSPVDPAALVAEAATALARRVLPTLQALPDAVPLVVMADHGFRENASWGRGALDRYAHGGPSPEESIVPVAVLTSP